MSRNVFSVGCGKRCRCIINEEKPGKNDTISRFCIIFRHKNAIYDTGVLIKCSVSVINARKQPENDRKIGSSDF